ncbi:ABC transporter ATP-binding protein [Psychromonas marina]|uniref:ABC transporter ATP-binding protein n=1 Tax=Psychromonas marina TaxID=88364 RepID=A0ABQ6E0Y1_9GAMM|nr:sn-glycerol-3-phosphate ABC transporter ATP-binding protein UgpC [Psychromonas marina]GLS91094.1 ABC transporter ATP-binding protein [Psychromonas marina]
MAAISLHKVVKRFGEVETIHGIDLDIKDGEFTVFVGPSGCGKSTLLRLIAGLEEITDGTISIGDVDVSHAEPGDRGVAMVFQSYALYPHMTVEENMGFGLKMADVEPSKIKKQVKHASDVLQLGPLLSRKPKELSGGQRQRVAIGRAIVRDPEVFLFDEPLSNLDAELRVEMRLQIANLHSHLGNTMVYVTHDQVEAMTLADRIVILRDGRVEQVGTPMDLYYKPGNKFVAGFIGSPKMNFIDAIATDIDGFQVSLTLPDGQNVSLNINVDTCKKGDKIKLGIRPEHIQLVSGESNALTLSFHADNVERLGNSTYLFGHYQNFDGFKVHIPSDQQVKRGDNMDLYIEEDNLHLFDEQGLSIRDYDSIVAIKEFCG